MPPTLKRSLLGSGLLILGWLAWSDDPQPVAQAWSSAIASEPERLTPGGANEAPPEEITVDLRVERRLLGPSEDETMAMVEISAPYHTALSPPIAVALILDLSENFAWGSQLATLKRATRRLVRSMSPHDRLTLITLGDAVEVLTEDALVGPNQKAILQRVDALQASGAMCLSCALEPAYRRLIATQATGARVMLLISNGFSSRGVAEPAALHTIAERHHHAHQIRVVAIGLGQARAPLMRALAEGGGGTYYFAPHPKLLHDYIQRELGLAHRVAARAATLVVRARDARLGQAGVELRLPLGGLASASRRRLLTRLTDVGREAQVTAALEGDIGGGPARWSSATLSLARTSDLDAASRAEDLTVAVERLRRASAMELNVILGLLRGKEREEAKRRLEWLVQELSALKKRADTPLLEIPLGAARRLLGRLESYEELGYTPHTKSWEQHAARFEVGRGLVGLVRPRHRSSLFRENELE